MYSSPNEYLIYLQQVLKQTDITDFLKQDKFNITELKNINPSNPSINDNLYLSVPNDFEESYQKTIDSYNEFFDKKSTKEENYQNPVEATLVVLLDRIKNSLSLKMIDELENIAIGSLFKLYPDAKIFKNENNHFVILISSSLLQLIYNNICLLEATSYPENVTFFSYSDKKPDLLALDSTSYIDFHKYYLDIIRETGYPYPVVFTFNDYSMDIVIDHFELITVFVIFHEYAHFINNDLSNNQFIDDKINEFKADETAIELIINHYLPHKGITTITETELILMIEYYFFRFLYFINITSKHHPTPGKRILNLAKKTIMKLSLKKFVSKFENKDTYQYNKDILRLHHNTKLFRQIYKMEEE